MLTARLWLLALHLSFISFTFSHRALADVDVRAHVSPAVVHPVLIAQVDPMPAVAVDTLPTDAGTPTVNGEDFAKDLAAVVADPSNVEAVARLVLHAIMTGQWGLLVSVLVMVLVAGLRKFVPEKSGFGQWLRSKLGGVVTSFTLSLAGAFGTSFLAGAPLSWALALKAVGVAVTASGSWALFKNVKEAFDEKKAQQSGEAAAEDPKPTLDK